MSKSRATGRRSNISSVSAHRTNTWVRHQSEVTVSKVKEYDNLSLNAPSEPALGKLVVGCNAISAGEIVKLDSTSPTM